MRLLITGTSLCEGRGSTEKDSKGTRGNGNDLKRKPMETWTHELHGAPIVPASWTAARIGLSEFYHRQAARQVKKVSLDQGLGSGRQYGIPVRKVSEDYRVSIKA